MSPSITSAAAKCEAVWLVTTCPRARLEEQLGCEVRVLTWLYGSPFGEHPVADRHTLAAGYDIVLSSAKIQRIA